MVIVRPVPRERAAAGRRGRGGGAAEEEAGGDERRDRPRGAYRRNERGGKPLLEAMSRRGQSGSAWGRKWGGGGGDSSANLRKLAVESDGGKRPSRARFSAHTKVIDRMRSCKRRVRRRNENCRARRGQGRLVEGGGGESGGRRAGRARGRERRETTGAVGGRQRGRVRERSGGAIARNVRRQATGGAGGRRKAPRGRRHPRCTPGRHAKSRARLRPGHGGWRAAEARTRSVARVRCQSTSLPPSRICSCGTPVEARRTGLPQRPAGPLRPPVEPRDGAARQRHLPSADRRTRAGQRMERPVGSLGARGRAALTCRRP